MQEKHKRGLVLVRVGSKHCIQNWLNIPKTTRNWDLAISLYEDVDLGSTSCIDTLHFFRGGKWDGIHAFFKENPDHLKHYDYFWLVDDDIEATPEQINELFDYTRSQGFQLAQPALTPDSFYTYKLTLQCPGFQHRYTNFVELMAPILSRTVLEHILPHFEATRTGAGIDWYWHKSIPNPEYSIAIIDAIPVGHRRPLRQHLHGKMREDGVCPKAERNRTIQQLKLKPLYAIARAGYLDNGQAIKSRQHMAWTMTLKYWRARREIISQPWKISNYITFFLKQAYTRLVY